MKPNKNIDRLFQEKLRDFEETPPDIVWENIEAHLDGKKKRRIIPIWWRYAGVAVVLFLLSFSAFRYFKIENSKNKFENTIVDIDKNQTPLIKNNKQPNNQKNTGTIVSTSDDEDVKQAPSTINKKEDFKNKDAFEQSNLDTKESIVEADTNVKKSSTKIDQDKTAELQGKKSTSDKKELIAKNNSTETTEKSVTNNDLPTKGEFKNPAEKSINKNAIAKSDLPSDTNKNQSIKEEDKNETEEVVFENIENLEDTLNDKFKLKEEELVNELGNRWLVATVVAPVFYNSFNTKGSPLDLQFENNPKEGSQSVSYGVKIGFKLNKKWSLQSGITMLNMGYSVGDVYINPGPQAAARLANIDYTSTGTILNVSTQNIINSNQIETSITVPVKGSLNQEYGYVEVPLEMKYSLTNGKLGVHLVGGFSTLFLNSNTVFVETPEFSSDLGEARNLNNIDFSGNLGFDVDYSINKHLYINVSPMLKVYTNTFSENYENSDNFKPYLFGVYTGLNYRF